MDLTIYEPNTVGVTYNYINYITVLSIYMQYNNVKWSLYIRCFGECIIHVTVVSLFMTNLHNYAYINGTTNYIYTRHNKNNY